MPKTLLDRVIIDKYGFRVRNFWDDCIYNCQ